MQSLASLIPGARRPERATETMSRPQDEPAPLRLLHAAVFLSSFDRLLIAPLLLPVAAGLGVPVAQVAGVATAYYVGYGLMQVVWGVVSDRLGRVRTMRLALAVAAVAGVATAVAPGVVVLLLARLVAGGAYAAAVPGGLIYIGDTVPAVRRHGPLTDLMTATAVGMAAGTLVGAYLADLLSWRVAFALPAVASAVVAVVLRGLPEPSREHRPVAERSVRGVVVPVVRVLRSRWPLTVLAFAFVEGMVLLGVLTYLPAMLQAGGLGTTASGAVTAAYGVGIVALARLVKRLSRRLADARLVAVGGTMGTAGYVTLVLDRGPVGVLVASVLLAGAWAFMHSTMQKWATEVAPHARATVVSLFASALFLGNATWTAFGAPFVAREDFLPYVLVGLGVAGTLTLVATVARHRYPER